MKRPMAAFLSLLLLAIRLLLPKTSSEVTECDCCASGRRDVRVPAQTPPYRAIVTEVTGSLEAENLVLRQQMMVLRRNSTSRAWLRNIDRLIFVWLYRCFPTILNAITVAVPMKIEMDYKEFRNVNNCCFSVGLSSPNCLVTSSASP
jgi:hypothetical protein